jgi:predicted small secreted protein
MTVKMETERQTPALLREPRRAASKLALVLALGTLALAGCNTVAGVGEDITGGARMVGDAIGGY